MRTKLLLLLLLILIIGCESKKEIEIPYKNLKLEVKIRQPDLISETKILISGSVIENSNVTLQDIGFCWDTINNPTIEKKYVTGVSNNGEFALEVNGLTPNRKYYIKAFARSNFGVFYSEQLEVTTTLIKIISEATYRFNASYEEKTIASVKTADGGFVVVGFINPKYGGMDIDAVLLKYNMECKLQWSKVFRDINSNESPASMIVDSDGNFVILSNLGVNSSLLKIDSEGNLLWRKVFDENQHIILNSITETKSGQYAMVGYCLINFGTHELEADRIFIKTNKDGENIFSRNYGNVNTQGQAKSLLEDETGNFLFIGNCSDQSSSIDLTLNKVDSQGNPIWRKNIVRNGDDWGLTMIRLGDGKILLSGVTNSFGPGVRNVWLLKLDWDGNILFEKAFGKPRYLIDSNSPVGLIETKNGDLLLAQTIGVPYGTWGDYILETDMYIIRTDAGGNHIWDKQFGTTKPYFWDAANSILELSNGEIIVAGSKEDDQNSDGDGYSTDIWVIKINGY
jgi:hypothetical protein